MVNLNKNFIALMCVCLPTQCWSQNINDLTDFVGLSYEIGWRAWASCYRNYEKPDIITCLHQQRFEDSIFNIIAEGIRDCALKKGFFSDQNQKVVKKNDRPLILIDCNADPKSFKQGEWNTILLFNWLWSSMHTSKFNIYETPQDARLIQDAQQRLRNVKDNLFIIYKGEGINDKTLAKYLDQAYKDIDGYATSLRLYEYLHEYQRLNRQPNYQGFSPNTISYSNFDPNVKSGSFRLSGARIELEGKKTPIKLDIIVEDGKVAKYKLWDNTGFFDRDKNLIGKFKTFKENFKLDNDFIEKQFKDKLLKSQQIHNLCNYYDRKGDTPIIVQDKCYLNSCLQAFHASATVRENVEKLNKIKAQRDPNFGPNNKFTMIDVSPVLKTIFNAIENGGMERWVKGKDMRQNLEPYRDALIKLADSLERSEAKRVSRTSLRGQELSPNMIRCRYEALLKDPNFSVYQEDGRDFSLRCHRIRFDGSQDTTIIAQELAHALGIEALDKNEEPIAPVMMNITYHNQFSNIQKVSPFPLRNSILDRQEIGFPGQEVCKKIEEIKQTFNNQDVYQGCIIMPQVAPVIIRPISYSNPEIKIETQTAYKEITQVVNNKEHKYRLVAIVHFPHFGGHYRATILTQDGWFKIDDIEHQDAIKVSDYDENSGRAWGENRAIVVYEPLY